MVFVSNGYDLHRIASFKIKKHSIIAQAQFPLGESTPAQRLPSPRLYIGVLRHEFLDDMTVIPVTA